MRRSRHRGQRGLATRWTLAWMAVVLVGGLLLGRYSAERGAAPEVDEPLDRTHMVGPCAVKSVIDGDTIDVVCDALTDRIRMLRIDTPEREEAGYSAARAALRELIGRKRVYLDFERPGELMRGNHGRVLAYVYVGDVNANLELVRRGWSAFDSRFGEGRLASAFEAAEREARRQRRGLWANR